MMTQELVKNITIHAAPERIWEALTQHRLMVQWMAEPEFELDISTDWRVGHPIVIKGFHHAPFINKGTVLRYEPYRVLKYNYISSLSHLPEEPQNFTSVKFGLVPKGDSTVLTVTLKNFPTQEIFKHVDFYWNNTLEILKKLVEKS